MKNLLPVSPITLYVRKISMPRKAKSQEELSQEQSQETPKRKRTVTRKATVRRKKEDMTEELFPSPELTPEELTEEVREIQEESHEEPPFEAPEDFMPEESAEIPYEDLEPSEPEPQESEQEPQETEQETEDFDAPQHEFTRTRGRRQLIQHPKPKYTYAMLSSKNLADLKKLAKEININIPVSIRKDDLIILILKTQAESMNYRFGGGTLEILPENFGFLRPKGMLPTDSDVYLSSSQIRRFGLRNGDVIWGLIRPPRDQEHYEALLRVETVNFSDPEHSRKRPMFAQLTPIFPDHRLSLEYDPSDLATRLVDMFAPIGLGQRALIVSPPKAGKTTLLKRIASAITANSPDVILMALLIDERPEEVTDFSRSIDGEVIASTFDRPADEHIRVANLALEKAKRLVEAKRDVVILLDSITRLARASNLTVPPSGRTLSGGLDPSGLYFPKRFFGAARNFEEGGSLTIIGTALTDTGSRMDDVIYEEFKGTGNMELHLSRKLSEQRIFPAIDITKSGTRREELLIPDDELKRLWILRKRIAGVDEAGALNLIMDKLRQTDNNSEFLNSIKLQ